MPKQVRELNASAVLSWRRRFRQRLDQIAARYLPRVDIDFDDFADMLSATAGGGGIILAKVTKDKEPAPDHALPRFREGGFPRDVIRCFRRSLLGGEPHILAL